MTADNRCPKCGGAREIQFFPTGFDRDHQYGYDILYCERCREGEKVR